MFKILISYILGTCLEDKIQQQEFKKLLRYLELSAAFIPLFLEFSNFQIILSLYHFISYFPAIRLREKSSCFLNYPLSKS